MSQFEIYWSIGTPTKFGTIKRMPKGPQGQKRPADVIGNAVTIAKIATGEIEDTELKYPAKHSSGLAGGKARAKSLSKSRRTEIAKKAADARWAQKD